MFSKLTLLTKDEQQKIHDATLTLLEKVGVVIGSDAVCQMLAQKGARVIGENVRFPKEMVEEMLSHSVHEFPLGAYNEKDRLVVPSKTHPFTTTAGYVPYIYDEALGKNRYATAEDLRQLCILADASPEMDCFWPMFMPNEYHGELQEFKATEIALRNIGKNIQCSSVGKELAEFQVEMGRIIAGGSEEFRKNPVLSLLSAPTTPLAIEHGIADAIVVNAKAGVPIIPMSLPQMSTTSPATVAADTLLVNAENLACHMIARCADENARIFYSSDAGAPNLFDAGIDYENSEYVLLAAADCDMARFYDLPSAMGCSVEFKDFSTKAGFERNVYRCALKQLTRVDVACWVGTRESCLSGSLIDVVLDLEINRQAKAYFRNFEVNEETLALDIIAERGPRGNYLDHEHTFKHFRENIFTSKAENCWLFENGYEDYRKVAAAKVEEIIANHHAPAYDEAQIQELDRVAKAAEATLSNG